MYIRISSSPQHRQPLTTHSRQALDASDVRKSFWRLHFNTLPKFSLSTCVATNNLQHFAVGACNMQNATTNSVTHKRSVDEEEAVAKPTAEE